VTLPLVDIYKNPELTLHISDFGSKPDADFGIDWNLGEREIRKFPGIWKALKPEFDS